VVIPCCASFFESVFDGDIFASKRKFGKCRRNNKAKAKATYQLRIASKDINGGRLFAPRKNPVIEEKRKTSLIRISKNDLQVDLEEESSKGNCHIGGKFLT
jgi:hypothetical protein